ncbi:hypothetical protein IAT40_002176 [Kwoniella sp. CBS 6097]
MHVRRPTYKCFAPAMGPTKTYRLLLGSYTAEVYDVRFTAPTPGCPPRLETVRMLDIGPNASWLCRHPEHHDIFYAALEDVEMKKNSAVAAYRVNEAGAELLDKTEATDLICHIAVVGESTGLACANYHGGSAFLIPLTPNGRFIGPSDIPPNYVKFPTRSSDNAGDPPKAHQVVDVTSKGEVWVTDCGNHGVWRLKLDYSGQVVAWNISGWEPTLLGHGPRQTVVSEDAAALTLHVPSATLTAANRLLKGEQVDSVAFFKIQSDGTLSPPYILPPSRGREYRGVGFVGDCFLVAGQDDGWIMCFHWNTVMDVWEEREFATPVNF